MNTKFLSAAVVVSMFMSAHAFAKKTTTTQSTSTSTPAESQPTVVQPPDQQTTTQTSTPDGDSTVTTTTPSQPVVAPAPAPATTSSTTTTTTDEDKDKKKGGLFVEPMIVGQSNSDSNIDTSQIPGASNTSGKVDSAGAGLRLGGHVADIVWLAAEGRYNRQHLKDSGYGTADADAYNYGVTLGVQTPWAGIRLWGTDILGGNSNPDKGSNGLKASFSGAHGYRAGGGLYIGSVALNLEYQDMTYNTTTLDSVGNFPINRDTSISMREHGPVFSLSFPITL